jgi:hypothetical protein
MGKYEGGQEGREEGTSDRHRERGGREWWGSDGVRRE